MPGRAARHSVQDHSGPSLSCSNIWFPNWEEGASEWTISGSKSTRPCSRTYECVSALHLWSRGRCSVPDGRQRWGEAELRPYRPLPANASWWQQVFFFPYHLVLPSLWCVLNILPIKEAPSWVTAVMHRWPVCHAGTFKEQRTLFCLCKFNTLNDDNISKCFPLLVKSNESSETGKKWLLTGQSRFSLTNNHTTLKCKLECIYLESL